MVAYLERGGFAVVARNLRLGRLELDIVARRGDTLVFCEVKARSGPSFGDPLEAVGVEKARRVRRAAEAFLAFRPDLAALDVRLEVAAVRGRRIEWVALQA